MEPFDDLELCFESVSTDWPGMIVCVYHLKTTPLLQSHLIHEDCGVQDKWDGGGTERGRIYHLETLLTSLTTTLNLVIRCWAGH